MKFWATILFILAVIGYPLIQPVVNAGEGKELHGQVVKAKLLSTIDEKQLWGFAEGLMKEGEYYRAITEYKRFISYYPDSGLIPTAHFRIGMAFFKGGKFEEARNSFIFFSQEFPEDPLVPQALFLVAEADYKKGDYELSLNEFMEIGLKYPDLEIGHRARYMVGWVLIRLRSWDKAQQVFQQIESHSPFYTSASRLGEEVGHMTLPKKEPALAGVLSAIMPGAGQFYAGRYRDGMMALLVNGGFIGGAIEAFSSGQDVLGGLLVFLGFSWYTGNIYSAVNSAHKFNRDQEEGLIDKLEREHGLYLEISEKMDKFFVGLRWNF